MDETNGTREAVAGRHESVVEFGWLVVHALSEGERSAVIATRDQMLTQLRALLPNYQWRMPLVEWSEPVLTGRELVVDLLKEGTRQREQRHWDYVLVITPADLCAFIQPHAMAAPSRLLSAAVLSLARVGVNSAGRPDSGDTQSESNQGVEADEQRSVDRLTALIMHLLGDLNDLPHSDSETNFMFRPAEAADLDKMRHFDDSALEQLQCELAATADVRLEEMPDLKGRSGLLFTLRALWLGREEIGSAVLQATPWQFPFRLSGLSTAAISTLIVLLASAEGWELGMTLSSAKVTSLGAIALLLTSAFIIRRQGLLVHRPSGGGRLTEQAVFSNASAIIVVALGMVTTWLMLFLLALLVTTTLFPEHLVQSWAASLGEPIRFAHYLTLAGFTAATGIVIGALGASFEGQQYFQHIAFVDEEL